LIKMVGRIKKAPRAVEQTEGTVYVCQPPRSEWIPSISPEFLKVETWLRMMQIPYEHIDHDVLTVSANNQLPHCKIGGKDVPYSNHMTGEIAKAVNKDTSDGTESPLPDNGAQRAFEGLIEGRLHWVLIYLRATQANQLPQCDGFQGRWQFLRPIANKVVASKLKAKADHQGIGRQNAADVLATGKQDLRAISAYLGEKDFMAGDQPNLLDATAFAYLSQFWYIPSDNEMKTYIKEQCPNLITYLERMKDKYWPDWEDKCRKPAPPRRTKSKEEPAQAVVGGEEKEEKAKSAESAPPAINGGPEKEATVNGEEKAALPKQPESTVEVVNAIVVEEKSGALENGVAEEQKHASTPNGGTAAEKVAE